MSIADLFNSVCCCSCGLCCSKDYLCNTCEINTLKSNGIPETYLNEIHGLKYKSSNHRNDFEFSELYYKLKDILKRLPGCRTCEFIDCDGKVPCNTCGDGDYINYKLKTNENTK